MQFAPKNTNNEAVPDPAPIVPPSMKEITFRSKPSIQNNSATFEPQKDIGDPHQAVAPSLNLKDEKVFNLNLKGDLNSSTPDELDECIKKLNFIVRK